MVVRVTYYKNIKLFSIEIWLLFLQIFKIKVTPLSVLSSQSQL